MSLLKVEDDDEFAIEGLIVVPGHRLAGAKPTSLGRELRFVNRRAYSHIMDTVRAEQQSGSGRSLAFTVSLMCDGVIRVLRDYERVLIRALLMWTLDRDAAADENRRRHVVSS